MEQYARAQDSSMYKFLIDSATSLTTEIRLEDSVIRLKTIVVKNNDGPAADTAIAKLAQWSLSNFEKALLNALYDAGFKDTRPADSIKAAFQQHTKYITEKKILLDQQKILDLQNENDQLKNILNTASSAGVFKKEYLAGSEVMEIEILPLRDRENLAKLKACAFQDSSSVCDSIVIPASISLSGFSPVILKLIDNIYSAFSSVGVAKRTFLASTVYNDWKSSDLANKSLKSIEKIIDSFTKVRDTATVEISFSNPVPLYRLSKGFYKGKHRKKIYLDADCIEKPNSFLHIQKALLRIEDGFITSISITPRDTTIDGFPIDKVLTYNYYIDIRSAIESGELLDHFFPIQKISRKLDFYIDDIPSHLDKKRQKANTNKPSNPYVNILYFNLSDFLKYTVNIDNISDVLVHVRNRNISFTGDTSKHIPLREKDFSSFAQINVYTDLIGLSENKPNGLLQFEGKFETDIFRTPINWKRQYATARWFLLSNAAANFSLTKLENKLRFLDIRRSDILSHSDTLKNVRFVATTDLIQYSNLNIGLNAKIVELASDYFRSYIYAGIAVVRTPLRDTALLTDQGGSSFLKETETVSNTIRFNYGINFRFKSTSRLGLETGMQFIHVKLNNADVKAVYENYISDKDTVLVRKASLWKNVILNPYLNIYYFLDQEKTKRMFVRAAYFRDIKSFKNDFTWFQFGYSTDMKGLFQVFSDAGKKNQVQE